MAFPGSADSDAKPALLPKHLSPHGYLPPQAGVAADQAPQSNKTVVTIHSWSSLQNSRGKEILPRLPHREWAPGQTTRWDNPSDIFSPSKKNPVPGHSGTRQVPTLPHNLLGFPVLKRNPHYIYLSVCVGIREQPREPSLSFYHTDLRDGSGHQAW